MEYITIPSDPLIAQGKIHILYRRAQQDPVFVMLTLIEKRLLQKLLSLKGLFLKSLLVKSINYSQRILGERTPISELEQWMLESQCDVIEDLQYVRIMTVISFTHCELLAECRELHCVYLKTYL